MGVVGNLGDIVFEVSDSVVNTFDKMTWSGSVRHAIHQRHLGDARTEYTGRDPDRISFEMTLSWYLGVDTIEVLNTIWAYERDAVTLPLVIGEKAYGKYRWVIENHQTSMRSYDEIGNLTTAVVQISIMEYLDY